MANWKRAASVGVVVATMAVARGASAQASAIPSAQAPAQEDTSKHGRELLSEMVTALGGDAWLHLRNWHSTGNFGNFYKGSPNDVALKFDEFHQSTPFATRFTVITHEGNSIGALLGVPFGKDHSDIVEMLTPNNAYEITYRGKRELPKDIVENQKRLYAHSVQEAIAWLGRPDTLVAYEGTAMLTGRQAERVSVIDAQNDTITLEIDHSTHLPISREFRYRDAQFKDFDLDREEYDNYQMRDGIMVPFTRSRYKNGDMIEQRFIVDIHFNLPLKPELFDPDVPLPGQPPRK